MSPARCRAPSSRYAAAAVTTCIVIASSLLAFAACANAEDANSADADGGVMIPVGDAGDDGSSDAAQDVDAVAVTCAVGNLCRVPTAFSNGGVVSMNGRSRDDVWASGVDDADGVLTHWDGRQWSKLDFDVPLSSFYRPGALSSIFLSPDAAWGAVHGNAIVRRELDLAPGRVIFTSFSGYNAILVDVAAVLEKEDVYLIARKYQTKKTRPVFRFNLETTAGDNLPGPFFLGTNEEAELTIRASFFVPNKALWLVGEQGAVARYPISSMEDRGDGGAAASAFGRGVLLLTPSHTDLYAAWGHGEEVWAAGRNGALLHFDGAEWHIEETGTKATLNAIFGVSPNDIWAVGEAGTVLHFDGSTWSPVGVDGYRGNLKAVWGSASDDVWIGGEGGMFHWGALQ